LSSQRGTKSSRRPKPRIESLSDLIYGLSLSIGAISLVITNGQASSTTSINLNIVEFLSVFLILITSWIIYTGDMSVLPIETRLVTFLNIVLLMLVAIIPYLFDQVVSNSNPSPIQDYASILFTGDYALTLTIMAIFAHIIAQEEKQLVDGEIMIRFRRSRNTLYILTGVVLVSLAAPWNMLFLQVHVRLLTWFVPIIMFWFNRLRSRPFGEPSIPSTS
jgi:hypothetical protein